MKPTILNAIIRSFLVFVLAVAATVSTSLWAGGTINVDYDFSSAATQHSGANGILSGSGNYWNQLFPNPTTYSNLLNEDGIQTSVGMYYDLSYWSVPNMYSGG